MSQSAVHNILNLIDDLSDSDRATLERHLTERAEAEWRKEAETARQLAKVRGIDQVSIDEAVRKHRYGK